MMQQASTQVDSACSQCGRAFAQSDLVRIAGNWVCGDCKPTFLSRVVAGGSGAAASLHSDWHYGGFWMRFAAVFIDGILMQGVRIPLSLLILGTVISPFRTASTTLGRFTGPMLALTLITTFVAFLYEVTLIRYYGATLGKMAVGVKVIRTDGSGVSWGISTARYFMKIVSSLTLMIGYIMAGFDDEKRALHDRVCDTRVIYKRGFA